jgi:RNA recognition motif-containing protein
MDIYVGNLAWATNDESLRAAFAAYGEVTSARVVVDRMSHRSKGFGFVEMPNEEEAAAAVAALNGAELDGRQIRANESQNKDFKREGGNGGRGGFRREGGFGGRGARREGGFGGRGPRREGGFGGDRGSRREGGFGGGDRGSRREGGFGGRGARREGGFGGRGPRDSRRPAQPRESQW